MANDTDWEAGLDWGKFDPIGGKRFYLFVKGSAIKSLNEGIVQLTALKAEKDRKLRSWGEVAGLAARLDDEFRKLVESEAFKGAVEDIDKRAFLRFDDGTRMTLGLWIECGRSITATLRKGSIVPEGRRREAAEVGAELAKAETLRDFLKGYVELSENDYRLRNAPVRFKTKIFRDALRNVNALVAAGAKINDGAIPDFLMPIKDEVDQIKEMAAKTQRTLRLAKKAIERIGDRFWAEGNPLNAVA